MGQIIKKEHKTIVCQKLQDKTLGQNLSFALHTLQNNRKKLIAAKFENYQALRDMSCEVKNSSLYNLKTRLVEFEHNAEKNGIKVHFADTDEDACNIIYEIIKQNNIEIVLKGKSMATEEIFLNDFLAKKQIKAIETDLGELIIQLINETPVHIVGPALHKNRYEIGKIFEKKLKAKYTDNIEQLNSIARKHLRNQFEGLKLGISGVNFAIAKEGAIWLIENEGNGRMCTTTPDIHVALCGIEKVLDSFEDAATLVHLLTPAACGQFIPTYNNIITGPRKNTELDGPSQVHVILMNNKRTDMLSHEDYYQALRCIRCGSCMNYCPVYDKIGGHAYQSIYPGPIGIIISSYIYGMQNNYENLSLCTLCNRCSEACPVKIPLHDLIRKLRADFIKQNKLSKKIKSNYQEQLGFKLFAKVATNGTIWKFTISNIHNFNYILHRFEHDLPVIKVWSKYKSLPEFKTSLYAKLTQIENVSYE